MLSVFDLRISYLCTRYVLFACVFFLWSLQLMPSAVGLNTDTSAYVPAVINQPRLLLPSSITQPIAEHSNTFMFVAESDDGVVALSVQSRLCASGYRRCCSDIVWSACSMNTDFFLPGRVPPLPRPEGGPALVHHLAGWRSCRPGYWLAHHITKPRTN